MSVVVMPGPCRSRNAVPGRGRRPAGTGRGRGGSWTSWSAPGESRDDGSGSGVELHGEPVVVWTIVGYFNVRDPGHQSGTDRAGHLQHVERDEPRLGDLPGTPLQGSPEGTP